MVRYLFYTIGDLTYQSPLVVVEQCSLIEKLNEPITHLFEPNMWVAVLACRDTVLLQVSLDTYSSHAKRLKADIAKLEGKMKHFKIRNACYWLVAAFKKGHI